MVLTLKCLFEPKYSSHGTLGEKKNLKGFLNVDMNILGLDFYNNGLNFIEKFPKQTLVEFFFAKCLDFFKRLPHAQAIMKFVYKA